MKKGLALFLAAVLAVSLWGCGADTPAPTETPASTLETTVPAEAPGITIQYPEIREKLTWEAINAFPVKRADMTPEEMRDLCVDFFLFSKTALWIPDSSWNYVITGSGNPDEMHQGQIYGGLPYITVGGGNIYRLMDYIDEETGVVDMTEPMKEPTLFGNQCSYGSYWGWSRVVNSAKFAYTSAMLHQNGFLRVGPYTYDDSHIRYEEGIFETRMIIQENGADIMLRSYAQMLHADGLVTSGEAGHVMMCRTDPVVVYDQEGKIDAAESYVYILDQHAKWVEDTNEAGDTYLHKNYINRKMTFNELMLQGYIPFTFAEFLGTDPIEETLCTFNHNGNTITPTQVNAGIVTANYGISDIYANVKDSQGNVVLSIVSRSQRPTQELNFFKKVTTGQWEPYTDGNHTLEVVCQLSTGERLTVYTGQLVS